MSKKTFRRGGEWISELDTCFVSETLVKYIKQFDVIDRECLPSDHAPITVSLQPPSLCLDTLAARAGDLSGHSAEYTQAIASAVARVKPSLHFRDIDRDVFLSKLTEIGIETLVHDDINHVASNLAEVLYGCASSSRLRVASRAGVADTRGRCQRMLEENDHAKLWQVINWRGELTECDNSNDSNPSDDTFKTYSEEIFNPTNTEYLDVRELFTQVAIPVLDQPIMRVEREAQIKRLKFHKASGPDGVTPVLLKWLPAKWITFLATLFNSLFMTGSYPTGWMNVKMVLIFKSGSKLAPSNYTYKCD